MMQLTLCPVYPETMGVPLEEMDAVFGEGEYLTILNYIGLSINLLIAEELEERLEDEESERASLFSHRSRRSRHSMTIPIKPNRPGLLRRLLGRSEHRASYEPIRDGDE